MVTETAKGRNGVIYRYYNCRSFLQGIGCSSRRRRVDELDHVLLGGILNAVFTPENMRWIAQELMDQGDVDNRQRQASIDSLGDEEKDIARRLRRLFETIEAGSGLTIADVGPRIRELRARQDEIKRTVEDLDSNRSEVPDISLAQAMRAANYFREIVESCNSPSKVREFLSHIVKKASILDREAILEYWPERLVAASGGSQCVVSWLPDLATLRTVTLHISLPGVRGRKAA